MSWWYLIVWYLGIQILGLAVTPICFVAFYRFRDHGWGFAKTFGILLSIYPAWLLGHFFPIYGRAALFLSALALLGISAWLISGAYERFLETLKKQKRLILTIELVFLLAFLGFAWVRSYHSDLSPRVQGYGSEKFMDIQFVNGIRLSRSFPPQDPWLAGHTVNYYYYGYYTCAALSDLFGVPTRFGYNLALVTVAALGFLNVFLVGFQLTKRAWAGLIGAFVVMVLGNPKSAVWVLSSSTDIPGNERAGIPYMWACSRVIDPPGEGSTINEFPYFSFLWGDLHGHLSALPFVTLVLGCCLAVWPATGAVFATTVGAALTALAYGCAIATNPWDLPTYALVIIATALAFWRGAPEDRESSQPGATYVAGLVLRGVIIMLGLILVSPFALHFVSPKSGLNWDITQKTPMHQFFLLFGLHAWAIVIMTIFAIAIWFRRHGAVLPMAAIGLGLVFMCMGAWYSGVHTARFGNEPATKYWFVGWVVFWIVLWGFEKIRLAFSPGGWLPWTFFGETGEDEEESAFVVPGEPEGFINGVFVFVLIGVSLCIWLGCEFVAMQDFYGKDNERMNTLFKFYYGVWVFLGIVVAWVAARCWAWVGSGRMFPLWLGGTGLAGLAVLGIMCAFFPVRATYLRSNKFKCPDGKTSLIPTLDGMAYMQNPAYNEDCHPGDYEAINWLINNWVPKPDGRLPVILETSTNETYTYNSRFGTFTGLPTLLGWGNHEGIWRDHQALSGGRIKGNEPGMRSEITRRTEDIKTIYRTSCMNKVKPLLEKNGVDYVVVSDTERKAYGERRLKKFEKYMIPVFPTKDSSTKDTVIYRGFKPDIDQQLAHEECEELPDPERAPIPARPYHAVRAMGSPGSGANNLSDPRGLAVDEQGTAYVADTNNNRVQVINDQGQFLRSWGGKGDGQGKFDTPQDVFIDAQGRILVTDIWNGLIQIFKPDGTFVSQFGNPAGAKIGGAQGQFYGPRCVTADQEGNMFVCDTGNRRVQKFAPEGRFLLEWKQWRMEGTEQEEFKEPVGIACASQEVFVVDTGNLRVVVFDSSGRYRRHFFVYGTWANNVVGAEPHLEIGADGTVWVTSSLDGWVEGFGQDGKLHTLLSGFNKPIGARWRNGLLYVSETGAGKVLVVEAPGREMGATSP